MKQHNQTIGLMVRRMREQRGMTQVELSQKTGLSRATLNNIESGRGNSTVDSLAAIAQVFDCNLDVQFTPLSAFVEK